MTQNVAPTLADRRRAVRAVIFDMDGLMIDSESVYWEVGRRMARSFGKEVTDKTLGNMMGRKPIESVGDLRCRSWAVDITQRIA